MPFIKISLEKETLNAVENYLSKNKLPGFAAMVGQYIEDVIHKAHHSEIYVSENVTPLPLFSYMMDAVKTEEENLPQEKETEKKKKERSAPKPRLELPETADEDEELQNIKMATYTETITEAAKKAQKAATKAIDLAHTDIDKAKEKYDEAAQLCADMNVTLPPGSKTKRDMSVELRLKNTLDSAKTILKAERSWEQYVGTPLCDQE